VFVIVVQIRSSDPQALAAQHERYAELAGRFPGIRYKHVMRSALEPERYIDLMAWERREQSEAFGVDPAYQQLRPPASATRSVASERSDANPGYYEPVAELLLPGAAIGRQEVSFVQALPGREQALAAEAGALVAAAEALPGLASLRVLRNLGRPAQHVIVAAYVDAGGDESGASALASAAPTREAWARLAACCAVKPAPEPGSLVVRFDAPP
jgi:heme-degrading monooxygenase HmoA